MIEDKRVIEITKIAEEIADYVAKRVAEEELTSGETLMLYTAVKYFMALAIDVMRTKQDKRLMESPL